MKTLLHVVASPRGGQSRTLKVAGAFLARFREARPDWLIDEINLFEEELPSMSARQVDGKYILLGHRELYGDLRERWLEIERQIARFTAARAYLISTPMWNFTVPYTLKQYIDILVQPGYLFRFAKGRVEGLLAGRRLVVVASSGGAYSTPEAAACDHVESYLRTVFGFVGITDVCVVRVESLDGVSPAREREAVEAAMARARELAEEPFE